MSGVLEGIRQGERDAKASERAGKRGKSLGRGGRSGGSGFSRSAGRAAVAKMQTRGRGVSMQALKNGRGFAGIGKYALDIKKQPEIIFQNGSVASMIAASKLRPDIEKPVGHIVISLPPSTGKLDIKNWEAIVETARKALGLDDTFPLIAVQHNDTKHGHAHLFFSRVSVTGKVHDQANLGLKCAAIERIIEDKHGLPLVPPSDFKEHNELTKGEIEKANRTKQLPARLQIAAALEIAVQGHPTIRQFVERLQAAGVSVRANVATTGKMSGFSFTYNNISFAGSKISKEFSWSALQERVQHEQATDGQFFAELNKTAGDASDDIARAVAVINGLNLAVEQVSAPAVDSFTNISSDQAAVDRAVQRDSAPRSTAPARIAATVQPTIAGFTKSEVLDSSLRGWADNMSNRIMRSHVLADKKQYRALLDSRERTAAIATAAGFAIPDFKTLTDEQIVSLLKDLGDDQIEVKGTPDFCARIEAVGMKHNVKVTHEHKVLIDSRAAFDAEQEDELDVLK